jgi:hypothetical protein
MSATTFGLCLFVAGWFGACVGFLFASICQAARDHDNEFG